MGNELIEEKSWWKQNWKWSVPITSVVFIAIIFSISSGFGGILANYSKAYSDSDLYENALKKVRLNKQVKDVLGTVESINHMTILNGSASYSNDNNSFDSTIKITCKNGKAMLDISADLINDTWSYKKINVRIKNPPENKMTIEIIKTVK